MAVLVTGTSVSTVWLAAAKALNEHGSHIPNLVVAVQQPATEDSNIRGALDRLISEHRAAGGRDVFPVETVANTIFPAEYFPTLEDPEARTRGYDKYKESQRLRRRAKGSRRGTYFERMIDWNGDNNQLERVITKLNQARELGHECSNLTEVAISTPEDYELRVYNPSKDQVQEGFPCLSHISVSLVSGRLHLTSTYRSQFFLSRAYGNLLGLGRLLTFISAQTGYPVGELVNVATHARLDVVRGAGVRRIAKMLAEAEGTLL
jgi:hypothetical protein